jgi:hypothetical protein
LRCLSGEHDDPGVTFPIHESQLDQSWQLAERILAKSAGHAPLDQNLTPLPALGAGPDFPESHFFGGFTRPWIERGKVVGNVGEPKGRWTGLLAQGDTG